MGLAVGLLVIYTLLFGTGVGQPARHGSRGEDALVTRMRGALAAQAAQDDPAGMAAAEPASPVKAAEASGQELEALSWGSDPFVRDWLLMDELAELDLKAITMGGDRAYVLINDQILEEGDVIGGKRIVTIDSDKVILEQGGRSFTLMLGE